MTSADTTGVVRRWAYPSSLDDERRQVSQVEVVLASDHDAAVTRLEAEHQRLRELYQDAAKWEAIASSYQDERDAARRESDSLALQVANEQGHNGVMGRALATAERECEELRARVDKLESSLKLSACPRPIGDDDGTVYCCVTRGHCGCDNAAALAQTAEGGGE